MSLKAEKESIRPAGYYFTQISSQNGRMRGELMQPILPMSFKGLRNLGKEFTINVNPNATPYALQIRVP